MGSADPNVSDGVPERQEGRPKEGHGEERSQGWNMEWKDEQKHAGKGLGLRVGGFTQRHHCFVLHSFGEVRLMRFSCP